jgi:hypothetical protein
MLQKAWFQCWTLKRFSNEPASWRAHGAWRLLGRADFLLCRHGGPPSTNVFKMENDPAEIDHCFHKATQIRKAAEINKNNHQKA